MKLKNIFIFTIILFVFISMSTISANDNVTDCVLEADLQETVDINNDELAIADVNVNTGNDASALKMADESYLKENDMQINAEIVPINLEARYGQDNFTFKLVDLNTNMGLEGKKLAYTLITGGINSAGSVTTDANGIATLDNSKLRIYNNTNNETGNYDLTPVPINIGKQLFSIRCSDDGISAAELKGNFTIKSNMPPIKLDLSVPSTFYYNSGNLATVKITDRDAGKGVAGAVVIVQIFTGDKSNAYLYSTDDDGIVDIYESVAIGSHRIVVSMAGTGYENVSASKDFTVKKANAKITANKVSAYYNSGKNLTIKVTNTDNGKAIYNAHVNVKMTGSGSKYYTASGQTLVDGTVKISLDDIVPGTYNVVVSNDEGKNINAKKATTKVTIKKIKAKATAPKVTVKYKKSKTFKITVKANNKPVKKAKLTLKVGKKSYSLTTNSKGVASFNTKKLAVGKYAVSITSKDPIYAFSAKSSIVIKK